MEGTGLVPFEAGKGLSCSGPSKWLAFNSTCSLSGGRWEHKCTVCLGVALVLRVMKRSRSFSLTPTSLTSHLHLQYLVTPFALLSVSHWVRGQVGPALRVGDPDNVWSLSVSLLDWSGSPRLGFRNSLWLWRIFLSRD